MKLIYIDDLIFYFLEVINNFDNKLPDFRVNPYEITLQELVDKLYKFKQKIMSHQLVSALIEHFMQLFYPIKTLLTLNIIYKPMKIIGKIY